MSCTTCGATTHITATCPSQVPSCSDCPYTLNADCIKYKGEPLSVEDDSVTDGSTRTLSDLLALLSDSINGYRQSNIIDDDYTVVSADTSKIILLQGNTGGSPTYTITLPETSDFFERELIFKDISLQTTTWVFGKAIQQTWNPTASSTAYSDHADSFNVVRLRFIKTTSTAYQWVRV